MTQKKNGDGEGEAAVFCVKSWDRRFRGKGDQKVLNVCFCLDILGNSTRNTEICQYPNSFWPGLLLSLI